MKIGRLLLRLPVVAIGVIGSAALAADALPLVRGIYVLSGTPCKGASNSDTLSYWGGSNGINSQQEECTVTKQRKRGTTYVLESVCRNIRYEESSFFPRSIVVTVVNPTSFIISGDTYRYCGPKVQF